MRFTPTLCCAAFFALLPLGARAAENRFRLLDYSDEARKEGMYLSLENKTAGDLLRPDALQMYLTVGNGREWQRTKLEHPFQADEVATVRLEAGPAGVKVSLNGKPTAAATARFIAPGIDTFKIAETEKWFRSPTTYRIEQGAFRLTVDGVVASGNARSGATGQQALFEFPLGRTQPVPKTGGTEITFETTFRIAPVTPAQLAGAVDRYGQAAAGRWPGKVTSDDDLKRSLQEEERSLQQWPRPPAWDTFGGQTDAPWQAKASGYYRVIKRDGQWWMISPQGHPLFYTGLCVVPALIWAQTPSHGREDVFQELPPHSGVTAELWSDSPWGDAEPGYFSPGGWNLIRKFGSDWKRLAIEHCARRMDAWAFSGMGKFSDREDVPGKPRVETIKTDKIKPLVRHIDVFDPKACADFRAFLDKSTTSWRTDPRVVGFSVGNEYGEVFTTEEIRDVLALHPDSGAAKAIRSALSPADAPSDDQLEKARQFYAEAYYAFVYRTMKELAPNHLYFGFWITPGWWQNESDWDMIVRHCDVVGYDKYALKYGGDDGLVLRLIAKYDKPTIVGEFSMPPWYGGERGFCRYSTYVETDREAGELYAAYVKAAAADPRCVGAMWFQYRDEPITGWGGEGDPSSLVRGESHAEGLVDITDQPKWDLVTRVRETNLRVTPDRLRQKP